MKKTILKSILIAGLFGAWACTDSKPNPEKEMPKDSIAAVKATGVQYCDTDHYTDLDVAMHHIENYACYLKNLNASHCGMSIDSTKAFLVSKCDLLSVLGLPVETPSQYDYVRVYFGLTDNNSPKLYITPVVNADPSAGVAGEDVILTGLPGSGLPAKYVLDLNFPCPNLCSSNSPLNRNCSTASANAGKTDTKK